MLKAGSTITIFRYKLQWHISQETEWSIKTATNMVKMLHVMQPLYWLLNCLQDDQASSTTRTNLPVFWWEKHCHCCLKGSWLPQSGKAEKQNKKGVYTKTQHIYIKTLKASFIQGSQVLFFINRKEAFKTGTNLNISVSSQHMHHKTFGWLEKKTFIYTWQQWYRWYIYIYMKPW